MPDTSDATSPQPATTPPTAREKLTRAAQLRREALALQRQHDEILYRKTPHGYARPPFREQQAAKIIAERDARRSEASKLEQEADQMLH